MPKTSSDPTIYSSLPETDEIRLLRLAPKGSGVPTGTLLTFSLADIPRFYALSYVWGRSRKAATTIINGKPLPVTGSLAEALLELSRPDHVASSLPIEYIWIDQICINQSDVGERRHQVTLMGQIYTTAARTIVWLGEDHNSIACPAFELCEELEARYLRDKIKRDGNDLTEDNFLQMDLRGDSNLVMKEEELPNFKDPRWDAFASLVNKPWFKRLWIIQEAVLSPEDPIVLFGSASTQLRKIFRANHWLLRRQIKADTQSFLNMMLVDRLFQHRMVRRLCPRVDISWAIHNTTDDVGATDPRDKVWGLTGLVDDETLVNSRLRSRIRVNYEPSYTPADAFSDVARHIIITSRSLVILAGGKCPSKEVEDVTRVLGRQGSWKPGPSWTPSFDNPWHPGNSWALPALTAPIPLMPDYACPVPMPEYAEPTLCLGWSTEAKASASIPATILHPPVNRSVLTVKGIYVDELQHVQETNTYISVAKTCLRNSTGRGSGANEFVRRCKALQNSYGRAALGHYLLQTARSARKPFCLYRLWYHAVKTTNRDPCELARAILRTGTSNCLKSTQRPPSEKSMKQFADFLLWHAQEQHGQWHKSKDTRLVQALNQMSEYRLSVYTDSDTMHPYKFTTEIFESMANVVDGRRFFITKEGRIGLGPNGMRKGDAICVLFGGGVPFVLRRRKSDRDTWAMVGEGWVDGLMQGQAVDAMEKGQLRDQTFEIH